MLVFHCHYKLFFISLFIISFFLNLSAFSQKSIYLGIKVGISQSNINLHNNFFPTIIETSNFNSYNFSVVSEFTNEKNVGIRIEFNNIQRGYFQNFSSGNKLYSKLNYIQLPFLLQYYFLKKKNNFYINIGPYFEYLIKYNNQEIPPNINSEDVYFFNEDRDKKYGYGLKLSIGFSNLIRNNNIQLECSYIYNFSNLITTESKSELLPDVSNISSLSLSMFYLFNIK